MKANFYNFLIFLLLVCSCTSQDAKNPGKFTLNGKITGQDSGIIILSYSPSSSIRINDTALIKNGAFNFQGSIVEPTLAQIISENETSSADLYLEPGVMTVNLTKNRFRDLKMTGSKTQDELIQLNLMLSPINKNLSVLNKKRKLITDSILNSQNSNKIIELQKESKELENQYFRLRKELNTAYLKFVVGNPDSYVTPYYLDVLKINGIIPYDSLKLIFFGLHQNIQNSIIGKKIKEEIRKKDNIQKDATVPDFKAIDLNNNTITLSQFKNNNVVIVDFWASWCEGCRAAFPHLKDLYKKYNPQGLEIVAFEYRDVNKETWLSAINHDSINMWHNIATIFQNGDTVNKGIIDNFPLPGIPLTILIGKDGKVIGSWMGYSEQYVDSLDKKLSETFKY
jgi:thiol-disulfide isomerase/thioredoxin